MGIRKYFTDLEAGDSSQIIIDAPYTNTPIDLTNGLRNYWKLDEASGTRFDSVGNDDMTNVVGTPLQSPGVIGSSLGVRKPSTDFVSSPTFPQLSTFTNGFSFSFWVKYKSFNDANRFQFVISKENRDFGQRGFSLATTSDNRVMRFALWNTLGNPIFINSSKPKVLDQWFHVVATFDAVTREMVLYTDGDLDGTDTFVGDLGQPSSAHLCLGTFRQQDSISYSDILGDMDIDEVGFWERPLSETEVRWLYNNSRGRNYWSRTGKQSLTRSNKIVTGSDIQYNILREQVLFVEATSNINVDLPSPSPQDRSKVKVVLDNPASGNTITVRDESLATLLVLDATTTYSEFFYKDGSWGVL